MPGEQSSPSLKAVIARVLSVDPSILDDTAGVNETENWDSIHQFLIMTEVEQTFGVKFNFSDLENAENIGRIRQMLAQLGVAAGD